MGGKERDKGGLRDNVMSMLIITMSYLLLEPILVSPVHPKLHLQIKKCTKSTFVGTIDCCS